jgi:hypothetical protein
LAGARVIRFHDSCQSIRMKPGEFSVHARPELQALKPGHEPGGRCGCAPGEPRWLRVRWRSGHRQRASPPLGRGTALVRPEVPGRQHMPPRDERDREPTNRVSGDRSVHAPESEQMLARGVITGRCTRKMPTAREYRARREPQPSSGTSRRSVRDGGSRCTTKLPKTAHHAGFACPAQIQGDIRPLTRPRARARARAPAPPADAA